MGECRKRISISGRGTDNCRLFFPKNKKNFGEIWAELIPIGAILYSIPIISFGVLHFIYGKDVATMVPAWIPFHLFWIYFAGMALLGSGIAIILKIKSEVIAALLGLMIFIWFIILHIPDVISSSPVDLGDQVASAFLALAYSGIAFVVAGAARKNLA